MLTDRDQPIESNAVQSRPYSGSRFVTVQKKAENESEPVRLKIRTTEF
jgi:hypothetical protein